MEPDTVRVQVVYATPSRQWLRTVVLPQGSTVADALAASGLREEVPVVGDLTGRVGIFGKPVPPATSVRDGDRVEIYRPLLADPRELRRRRAARRVRPG